MYDWPNDFVYCASEFDLVKEIGTIELLQLLLLLLLVCQPGATRCPVSVVYHLADTLDLSVDEQGGTTYTLDLSVHEQGGTT